MKRVLFNALAARFGVKGNLVPRFALPSIPLDWQLIGQNSLNRAEVEAAVARARSSSKRPTAPVLGATSSPLPRVLTIQTCRRIPTYGLSENLMPTRRWRSAVMAGKS